MTRDNSANYQVVHVMPDSIVIKDLGPWDVHKTVTNDIENVIDQLSDQLQGRRLYYFDSENNFTWVILEDGKFSKFQPPAKDRYKYEGRKN